MTGCAVGLYRVCRDITDRSFNFQDSMSHFYFIQLKKKQHLSVSAQHDQLEWMKMVRTISFCYLGLIHTDSFTTPSSIIRQVPDSIEGALDLTERYCLEYNQVWMISFLECVNIENSFLEKSRDCIAWHIWSLYSSIPGWGFAPRGQTTLVQYKIKYALSVTFFHALETSLLTLFPQCVWTKPPVGVSSM